MAASTTGWRPPVMQKASSAVTIGRHPARTSGEPGAGLQHIGQRQGFGTAGDGGALGKHAIHEMLEDQLFAVRRAFGGGGDSGVEFGQFDAGEAGAIRHALAQHEVGMGAQPLHRGPPAPRSRSPSGHGGGS